MWLVPQVNSPTDNMVKSKPHLNCRWSGRSEMIFSPYLSVVWEKDKSSGRRNGTIWEQALPWATRVRDPRTSAPTWLVCHLQACEQWGFEAQSDTPHKCSYFGSLNPGVMSVEDRTNPSYLLGFCSLGRSQPGRQLPLQIPLPGNNALYFWKEDKTKEKRAMPTNIHLLFYLCKAPAPSSPQPPVV